MYRMESVDPILRLGLTLAMEENAVERDSDKD